MVSYCPGYSHYNQGSQFQNNLNLLFANLTTGAPTTYFYNYTTGNTPNKVYGLFFCDSLVTNEYCHECVRRAVGEVQQRCAFSKEFVVWYVGCMLRYAHHPIFSISDVSIYYQFVFPPVIYNCTPDLSSSDCMNCLQTARGRFPMIGARVAILLQPSCTLAYNFNDTRSLKPEKKRHVVLGVTAAVAGASLLLNVILLFLKKRKPIVHPTGLYEIESNENLQFEFEAIKSATDNFSPAYKLGRGGFGVVYMGKLPDGQAVAVKRLSNASGQGIREFKTEASLAAKLQHKNLVKVYGFCLEGDEKLLVYDFVPNQSLDRFLFGMLLACYVG